MKINWKLLIGLLALVLAGALAAVYWEIEHIEVHTVEFTPAEGFVYFSSLNDPIDLEVNLTGGPQELKVTMDDGSLFKVVISREGKPVYEGEIVYTGNLKANIPEDGAYIMTVSGEYASGSLYYDADREKEDRGTLYYDN